MPAPLVVAGLWTAARWTATRALPYIARGVGSLFSRKLSWGGLLLVTAAPTVLSYTDRMTGHALSESLVKTPFGDALETLLDLNEWSNDQVASVPSNLITVTLEDKQVLHESDPDYDRSKKMIDAISHAIIGDVVGAATIAGDIGIELSDIVAAINTAKSDNPEASLGVIGAAAFADVREQLRQEELQINAHVNSPEIYQETDDAIMLSESFRRATQYSENLARVQSLVGSGLSSEFNSVVQEDGLHMFSSVNMFFAKVLDFIGLDSLSDHFKRAVVTDSIVSEFSKAAENTVKPDATILDNQYGMILDPR